MASAELIDDPFEARLRFIDVLKHVTASQKTIHGATAFALKNAHADDELFSCLLETLQGGSVSLSQRLNILSVADAIASEAAKPGARDSQYLMLVKEHAKDIVDAAIPSDDPKSEVNRPIVQRIVEKWIRKGIASNELLQHIHQLQSSAFSNKDAAFSKQEVQKRMEDDWERSRRSKEEAWRQESIESQFEKLYERSNALNLDDVSHIQSELRHWRRWKKAVEEEPLRVLIWDFNDLFIKGRRHYRNDPRKGDDVLDEIRRLARKCHARFLETKSLPHRTLLEPHSEIDPAYVAIVELSGREITNGQRT